MLKMDGRQYKILFHSIWIDHLQHAAVGKPQAAVGGLRRGRPEGTGRRLDSIKRIEQFRLYKRAGIPPPTFQFAVGNLD
jgi:hypothetical protein